MRINYPPHPTHQILGLLRAHDCKDVTRQLDLSKCSQFPISTGGFGDIFKGHLQDGNLVAIKCLRLIVGVDDKEGQRQLRRAAHEIYVWSKCKHPNVLELIGVVQYRDRIAMVSPWMEKGSLTWFLSQNPTVDKYEMCVQIGEGVAHLHANGIVHGDIKGSNILVSHDHIPKLADFGTSFLSTSQYTLQFTRGTGSGINSTVRYTAPEILKEETKLTTEGDIYALGMAILEAITGTVPYEGCLDVAVIQKVTSGIHPARPEQHLPNNEKRADAIWSLLKECWDLDPVRRPSAIMTADRLKTIVRGQQYAILGEMYSDPASLQNPFKRTPVTLLKNTRLASDKTLSSMDNLNIEVSSHASNDKRRLSVSIDFGTTFSGVAYGSPHIAGGKVQQILQWPSSFENLCKIPTCLLYGEHGEVLAWGLEAKNASPIPGSFRCEWFKLFLEPNNLRRGTIDSRLPRLPPGKQPMDAIIDFLSCLWSYVKQQIEREIGAVADLNTADVWLTVPAAWDAKGCDMMREAAIASGLVESAAATKGTDKNWKERLRIITEPEAAAVHCAHLTNLHQLRPSQNFMICDAGGGTVDLAIYKILGSLERLEIGEVCARSGKNCGSLYLDLRFRHLVARMLEHHPAHTDISSLAYFQHAFSGSDKLTFRGEEDDRTPFQFNCFNVEDPDDPAVGLINGELTIPGALLRTEVFDPVISEVLQLIEEQIAKCNQPIHALLLVGGFTGSEYLFKRVDQRFGSPISVIARPADADTATCRGAARYGFSNRALVSSVIAPRAYIMKVKLPADPEDWQKRPAYISQNNPGVPICENRLQYLVQKGAILRKGQRVKTKFCKFSQGPQDSTFVAVLYTSESERVMRYTDEGETSELCKWTVDLSTLPSFAEHARIGGSNGFYTEFELELELDSAEVRGVLLYNGDEWGRVVFEFLN